MFNAHPATFRAMAVLAAATALAAANTGAALAAPGGGGAAIPLNVGQETTGSNTGAHGFFNYDIVNGEFCYTLSVEDLSAPVAAAHIHVGARKVAGPVVIPLEIGTGTTWTETACVPADATVLAALEANPRAYYVNVHTPTFPGGEVRGQLK